MKADEITSEQAWEDFKAGYPDFEEKHVSKGRDGDVASDNQKIEIMTAKIQELQTDVSRLVDSIPQALGTIEEGKTLEAEAEEEMGAEELGEGSEDGELFEGDDELDEYFAGEGAEEDSDEDSEEDSDEEETDGEIPFDEDSDDDAIEESDDDSDDESDDAEVSEDDDEPLEDEDDYIPMDELTDDEEDDESDEEDDEEPEEDNEEEVLEKMVRVLTKMDRRLTRLERENEGLKKQLAKRNTVTTETNMAKSRPRPNTNLRLVKGSYNRPPVSTQYVANQRDIGIGMQKKESPGKNTSVFDSELNEVFAECNRIANQTR